MGVLSLGVGPLAKSKRNSANHAGHHVSICKIVRLQPLESHSEALHNAPFSEAPIMLLLPKQHTAEVITHIHHNRAG
jgi:hypothetical protein